MTDPTDLTFSVNVRPYNEWTWAMDIAGNKLWRSYKRLYIFTCDNIQYEKVQKRHSLSNPRVLKQNTQIRSPSHSLTTSRRADILFQCVRVSFHSPRLIFCKLGSFRLDDNVQQLILQSLRWISQTPRNNLQGQQSDSPASPPRWSWSSTEWPGAWVLRRDLGGWMGNIETKTSYSLTKRLKLYNCYFFHTLIVSFWFARVNCFIT